MMYLIFIRWKQSIREGATKISSFRYRQLSEWCILKHTMLALWSHYSFVWIILVKSPTYLYTMHLCVKLAFTYFLYLIHTVNHWVGRISTRYPYFAMGLALSSFQKLSPLWLQYCPVYKRVKVSGFWLMNIFQIQLLSPSSEPLDADTPGDNPHLRPI